jgi:hypothetical protein
MPRFLAVLLAVIVGPVLGWLLLAGFCSIPGISFSTACGHNAYVWLPLFIPLGIAVVWFGLSRIARPSAAVPARSKGGDHENA